jgi:hypothetical protein
MKASKRTVSFRKTVACPTSATLLSFRCNNLPEETVTVVKDHLDACDFCNAELPLLAHHRPSGRGGHKPPEIPMNLRILAESILVRPRIKRIDTDQN